jgi:hypothetical protein
MSRRNGFGGRERGASRRFPRACPREGGGLQAQGHEVSRILVGHLLNEAGYSLQGNRKTTEGDSHPDRDAQFGYINTQVTTALADQQPVISVDTKKKELVGDFRNNARISSPRQPGRGPGPRFPDQGARPRGALRDLRPRRQLWLGECRR